MGKSSRAATAAAAVPFPSLSFFLSTAKKVNHEQSVGACVLSAQPTDWFCAAAVKVCTDSKEGRTKQGKSKKRKKLCVCRRGSKIGKRLSHEEEEEKEERGRATRGWFSRTKGVQRKKRRQKEEEGSKAFLPRVCCWEDLAPLLSFLPLLLTFFSFGKTATAKEQGSTR